MTKLRGSCACGSVQYEITDGLIGPITYCHCWRCRKQSGSSFGTTAGVARNGFHLKSGAELVKHWESSPGVRRYFAGCCGTPIWKDDEQDRTELGFRLGSLDGDPLLKGGMHFHVGSKTPWFEITDSLPQEGGGMPFGMGGGES